MYKTLNFSDPAIWIKRILFISLFFVIVGYVYGFHNIGSTTRIVLIGVWAFLIVIGQTDELEITSKQLVIEQKSIVPFLRSRKEIQLSEIESMKKNSNFVHNDGHWFAFLHKRDDNLELALKDGHYEIINGKLHPRGSKGLHLEIEKYMNQEDQEVSTNSWSYLK